jgi:hypothetical protein
MNRSIVLALLPALATAASRDARHNAPCPYVALQEPNSTQQLEPRSPGVLGGMES